MWEITLIVLTMALTLLGERLVNAPRDVRRNNQRIGNRDEDLSTWIEDEAQVLRRETIRANIQTRPQRYAYLAEFESKQLRNQLLRRYRDQLRDAERVVRDVRASEQLTHQVLRRLLASRSLDWQHPSITPRPSSAGRPRPNKRPRSTSRSWSATLESWANGRWPRRADSPRNAVREQDKDIPAPKPQPTDPRGTSTFPPISVAQGGSQGRSAPDPAGVDGRPSSASIEQGRIRTRRHNRYQ